MVIFGKNTLLFPVAAFMSCNCSCSRIIKFETKMNESDETHNVDYRVKKIFENLF